LKIDPKRVRRTLYWFAAELAVLGIFLLFLVYKPAGYRAVVPDNSGRVSTYLTHQLGQDFYNKAQLGEPFELVIQEAGINDLIATGGWSGQSGDARASLPVVHFVKDKVVVMISVYLSGIEFVATVDVKPGINEEGKLTVALDSVKVGAVPVTIAAKVVAKKMYNEQISGLPKDDIRVRIARAMFEDQPFEPVMEVDGKTVKIGKIRVEQGIMRVDFVPVNQI
jgi:hypothetical protein